MRKILIWIKFTFFTLRTPRWFRNVFFKMVDLDMSEPFCVPGGSIDAKCSSMVLVDSTADEIFYVNYNHEKDQIYAQRAKAGKIEEVYREGQTFVDANFVIFLIGIHQVFTINKLYQRFQQSRAYGVIT